MNRISHVTTSTPHFHFSVEATSILTQGGAARQPDIDQQGANIIGVDEFETNTVTATGSVSAGSVSAPSGAIAALNTGTTQIQNAPVQPKDGTNKEYVDARISALDNRIADLEADSGSAGDPKVIYNISAGGANITLTNLTPYRPVYFTYRPQYPNSQSVAQIGLSGGWFNPGTHYCGNHINTGNHPLTQVFMPSSTTATVGVSVSSGGTLYIIH